jgi:hypothetical protein
MGCMRHGPNRGRVPRHGNIILSLRILLQHLEPRVSPPPVLIPTRNAYTTLRR